MLSSGRPAFDKVTGYIKKAKDTGAEVHFGGSGMLSDCLKY